MIAWALFLSGILVAAFGRRLNRVRVGSAAARRLRRNLLAMLVAGCWGLSALCLAAGGYMYWYGHRGQPTAERRALFRGVEYVRDVRRLPRPIVVHVVLVDLRAPGVKFLVTPPANPVDSGGGGRALRARKTSTFLREFGVQIAINANYFYPFRSERPWDYYPHEGDEVDPCGYAASRGIVYAPTRWRDGTLFISADNRATVEAPDPAGGPVYNAVAGNGFVVRRGMAVPPPPGEADQTYPRAAVGLDADRRTLLLLVVDGKQPGYSEGATLAELAQIALEYGGHDVIRLDEGGSCALAADGGNGPPGRVELLNIPINNRIPYRERAVANHLGVFAERMP